MSDAIRMNYILDYYVQEGRIAEASRAAWAGRYTSDPAGTEATLAALTPMKSGVLGHVAAAGERPQAQHMMPVTPRAELSQADLTPENVEHWTRDLFPETRAGAGAKRGRVTSDAQYKRGATA